jgi:hypothetical protein
MFRRPARHAQAAMPSTPAMVADRHVIASDFSTATCRFELACTCGSTFDTNYIDEALEWHELHATLAPLADELDVTVR